MLIRLAEEKERLGITGDDLLTRPVARKFVPGVISMLGKVNSISESIEVSFENIKTADTSFIDELLIVNVMEKMKEKKLPRAGFFLSHLSESTLFNASSVFGQKKIPILYRTTGHDFGLLGHLEKHLVGTLKDLMKRRNLRAVDISKNFGLAINVSSTKLNKLYNYGLVVRREEISEKGREYIYSSLF
jgi:hypothetical protein